MGSTISLPRLRGGIDGGDTIRAREPLGGRGNGRYVASGGADHAAELWPAGGDQRLLVRRRRPLAADLHRPHPGRRLHHRRPQCRSPDRTGDGRRRGLRPAHAHPGGVVERSNRNAVGTPAPLDGGRDGSEHHRPRIAGVVRESAHLHRRLPPRAVEQQRRGRRLHRCHPGRRSRRGSGPRVRLARHHEPARHRGRCRPGGFDLQVLRRHSRRVTRRLRRGRRDHGHHAAHHRDRRQGTEPPPTPTLAHKAAGSLALSGDRLWRSFSGRAHCPVRDPSRLAWRLALAGCRGLRRQRHRH